MKIAIPLWTIWFMFGLTYYGIILLTSRVYQKDSADDDEAFVCDFSYSEIFLSSASEAAGIALTAVVIDRWGRRGSQTSLYGCAGIGVALMGMQKLLHMSDPVFTVWALFARITSMAATSVTMVITPELFETKTRASGHAVGAIFCRLGGFCTPYLVNSSESVFFIAIVLGIGNIISMMCSFLLPETRGKPVSHDTLYIFKILWGCIDADLDHLSDVTKRESEFYRSHNKTKDFRNERTSSSEPLLADHSADFE